MRLRLSQKEKRGPARVVDRGENEERRRRGASEPVHDTDKERSEGVKKPEFGEGFFYQGWDRERIGMVFAGRDVRVPVVMDVMVVLVKVGMFPADLGMSGREFLAEPLGNAGEIENAKQDQHEADSKFHGETDAGRDDKVEEDDGYADGDDGDGVAESPKGADQGRFGERTLAAHDGGYGDDVIGIGGMAHAEQETDGENGEAGEHTDSRFLRRRKDRIVQKRVRGECAGSRLENLPKNPYFRPNLKILPRTVGGIDRPVHGDCEGEAGPVRER